VLDGAWPKFDVVLASTVSAGNVLTKVLRFIVSSTLRRLLS